MAFHVSALIISVLFKYDSIAFILYLVYYSNMTVYILVTAHYLKCI